MKNRFYPLLGILCLVAITLSAQVPSDPNNYGIWQTFGNPVPPAQYPEVRGRLCNFRWADLETGPGVWNWAGFDSDLVMRAKDTLPIIFMVYTESDAPDWLYDNGVPKVAEKDKNGNIIAYAPYYADITYKSFFKRMITTVHQHIETLPASVRSKIIAVQGCYGSTGDYISYKGTVAPEYNLTNDQFYQLFQEFSQYYYDEYKTSSPKICLLSNPKNDGSDQCLWLVQNCPGGWLKTGTLGKGYQLNDEVSKWNWLYKIINGKQAEGGFIRARSEIIGNGLASGWWWECPYKNMFALMCYDVYWGLDWSNQSMDQIDNPLFDSAFSFFNKYAGQKDASTSTNAMCALKDGLDASDGKRFPEGVYGSLTKDKSRFNKIANAYAAYGARLEDPDNAILSEGNNLAANGINDVGWGIFPGNYERYLHQINPNATSAGYWNVQSADSNAMYGRFARGFDLAKGKDALYFDVDDNFLNNAALNGAYPVMLEITYLDKGSGSWKLCYDSKSDTNKLSVATKCSNSGLWKKVSVTLTDAYFGNRAGGMSDFYIKSTNNENVIFSVVELTRPNTRDGSGVGFSASPVTSFDTVCLNSQAVRAVTLQGAFLDNSKVTVGPLTGFSFAKSADGPYRDSIILKGYGASFRLSLFIKFHPSSEGSFNGNITIKGGGVPKIGLPVTAYSLNSSPDLSATIKPISCYNTDDGAISLGLSGGAGPYQFSWSSDASKFSSSDPDITNLKPADYKVVVTSLAGCTTTSTYSIAEPAALQVNLSADTIVCKGGKTNLYVTATGGTAPYIGTGTFNVSAGSQSYRVTDARGCSDAATIRITDGSLKAPQKPGTITGNADSTGVCGIGDFIYFIDPVASAASYTWTTPTGSLVSSMSDDGATITLTTAANFTGGTLSVTANNVCGSSVAQTKTLSILPLKPGPVNGPASVTANATGLSYSIKEVAGLTYNWSVPGTATITAGQGTGKIKVTWGSKSGNVAVASANNCGSSSKSFLYVQVTGGLQSNTSSENSLANLPVKATIYPNPANHIAYLSINGSFGNKYNVEIIDVNGKLVSHKLVQADARTSVIPLDVHELVSGLYMVNVINEKQERTTLKLIRQ